MKFVVEFDEWTGSVWIRRESEALSEDDALYWYKYLHHQCVVKIRNATLKGTESAYEADDLLVL